MPHKRKVRRRGRGEGSITRRKDGLYQASVSLGRRADGSRHREFVYARTKAEVLEKLDQLRRQPPQPIKSGETRFGDFAEEWLEQLRPCIASTSYVAYRGFLRHLLHYLQHRPLRHLTIVLVEVLYRDMGRDGHSANQINECGRLLGRILRAACRAGLMALNPVPEVPRPRVIRREIVPLDPAQVTRLLAAARQDRYFAAFVLAIDSGMREGEILALAWPDLDLERGTVRVLHTLRRAEDNTYGLGPVKTKQSRRTIQLSPATVEVLRQHRQTAEIADHLGAPVFCNRQGHYLDPSDFTRRNFRRVLRLAQLPAIRFHDLRHTCATLLLLLGEKTHVVSERLGHSKPSITTDVYQHLLEGMGNAAAEKIQQLLGPALENG